VALSGATLVGPLLQVTRTVPIVFTYAADPVGASFVDSLARPGGNATGFLSSEYSISGNEIAPGVKRVAIMFNPDTAPGAGSYFLASFEAAARSLNVEPIAARVHSDAEIETVTNALEHGHTCHAGIPLWPTCASLFGLPASGRNAVLCGSLVSNFSRLSGRR
jgi:ABC-type uncharacterized transport system substrate-binding protein